MNSQINFEKEERRRIYTTEFLRPTVKQYAVVGVRTNIKVSGTE